jgi:predicted transcriptional regulator
LLNYVNKLLIVVKKINEHNIRVNDIKKMLVRNNLEISEYNLRANIIIKVLVKIIYGLVKLITG